MLPSSPHLLLLPKYYLPLDNNNISHSFKAEFASYLCGVKMLNYEGDMNFIQIFFLSSVTGLLPTTPLSFRYLLCVSDPRRNSHVGGSHKSVCSHFRVHNTHAISQNFTVVLITGEASLLV